MQQSGLAPKAREKGRVSILLGMGGVRMSSSPKFRIIVHGVAAGADPQRVRRALAARLGTEAAQLDQLLQNQGGALAELLDHQTAWKLKNLLQQLEVDC